MVKLILAPIDDDYKVFMLMKRETSQNMEKKVAANTIESTKSGQQ